MREPSIFRGIAVSLLRPVIGSNVEIDVIALNRFAHVRKQSAAAFKSPELRVLLSRKRRFGYENGR